jgi:protein-L-isoaspartate O-methyltransferase
VPPQIGRTALDGRVLDALAKVPRHEFVPVEVQHYAYLNRPLTRMGSRQLASVLVLAEIFLLRLFSTSRFARNKEKAET